MLLKEISSDKALGPDSFTFSFIRRHWDSIDKEINPPIIMLISKREDLEELPYFGPIGLLGSISKFVSKLLTDRFHEVMSSINGQPQGAFVNGVKSLMESWL